uniref:Uncharacterized protein n=1 Tax=Oncorhynchus kisutch TaxID=8019 RepID=A0A8C7GYM8_ONCKI
MRAYAMIRAGVSGLSTAQSIYEHYHSTVSQSTSDGPAGFWQPYLYDKGNSQKTNKYIHSLLLHNPYFNNNVLDTLRKKGDNLEPKKSPPYVKKGSPGDSCSNVQT